MKKDYKRNRRGAKDIPYIIAKYGIKYSKIANSTGVSYQNIYNWLNGYYRPTCRRGKIVEICEAFNEKVVFDYDKIDVNDILFQNEYNKL